VDVLGRNAKNQNERARLTKQQAFNEYRKCARRDGRAYLPPDMDRAKELQARLSSGKKISTPERQKMLCEMGESTRKAASLGNREAKLLYASLVARTPTSNLGTHCLDASPDTLREVETYITDLSIKEKTNDSLQASLLRLSDDLEAKSHGVDDPESVRRSRKNLDRGRCPVSFNSRDVRYRRQNIINGWAMSLPEADESSPSATM
jgi:hypothetical protein